MTALITIAGCSSQPDYRARTEEPQTVQSVDLQRYQGLWYEIMRYPNSFEDKADYSCVGVTAEYSLREDGRITVTNSCRMGALDAEIDVAQGVARSVSANNSRLKVRFAPAWIPFAEGDYWVLDLTEDYSAVLVGDPAGRYLWILARTPDVPEATLQRLLETAEREGYQSAPLIRTLHAPAE